MEEILELRLLIRDRAFAIFSTIEKVLACRKKSLGGPHAARGPYVVQACYKVFIWAGSCSRTAWTVLVYHCWYAYHRLRTTQLEV